jgi:hypothetical protein
MNVLQFELRGKIVYLYLRKSDECIVDLNKARIQYVFEFKKLLH